MVQVSQTDAFALGHFRLVLLSNPAFPPWASQGALLRIFGTPGVTAWSSDLHLGWWFQVVKTARSRARTRRTLPTPSGPLECAWGGDPGCVSRNAMFLSFSGSFLVHGGG